MKDPVKKMKDKLQTQRYLTKTLFKSDKDLKYTKNSPNSTVKQNLNNLRGKKTLLERLYGW